ASPREAPPDGARARARLPVRARLLYAVGCVAAIPVESALRPHRSDIRARHRLLHVPAALLGCHPDRLYGARLCDPGHHGAALRRYAPPPGGSARWSAGSPGRPAADRCKCRALARAARLGVVPGAIPAPIVARRPRLR